MNKTALKIFFLFSLTAAPLATFLLVVNFMSVGFIGSDRSGSSPKALANLIGDQLEDGDYGGAAALVPEDCWCLLIDGGGDALWSVNLPADVPTHYSLGDVARLTRWYLNDYPVYVRTIDEKLVIYGTPKNSVGKYDIIYSMKWFERLPQRILTVLLLNLALALTLALIFGAGLYDKLRALMDGLENLKAQREVNLPERGLFGEIFGGLNSAAGLISRKNAALAARDTARSNWVSAISHDIRTPLSLIMGVSEELAADPALSPENKKKAGLITGQALKIRKLIEDLNLISSLEYDMQPSRLAPVKLCPLLRRTAAELVNGCPDFAPELDLRNEGAAVMGDESLLERAVFNLLNNSLVHNPAGCAIRVTEYVSGRSAVVEIADGGSGVPPEALENLDKMPRSGHGMGLPMAWRIVRAHGGTFEARNDGGLKIRITLPLM